MLASLIDKHPPESMTVAEVRALLGEPTEYADYEVDLAYAIAQVGGVGRRDSGHMLIYRTDKRTRRILHAEVISRP